MSNAQPGSILDLGGLLGETTRTLFGRFGPPSVDRVSGEDRWMVYEGDFGSLRVRAGPVRAGGKLRVRSWTFTFSEARASLELACRSLGVSPAGGRGPAPPVPTVERRPLPNPGTDEIHTLTAVRRDGAICSVTAFDEPPDWVEGTLSS